MKRIKRNGSSRAMIVACVALVAAVGSTSYAAVTLPKGGGTAGQVQQGGAAPDAATGPVQPAGLKATTSRAGLRPGPQANTRQQSARGPIAGKSNSARASSSAPQSPAAGVAGLSSSSASTAGVAGAK
jgi:hypothetical protein